MSEVKSRLHRIFEYVDSRRGKRLTIRFIGPDGEERTGSVDDLIAQRGRFVKVLSGNSLEDLDMLLAYELRDI